MAKFSSSEWDEIRKKFHHSIMADTSLVSLAENLDTSEWPHAAEDEKPSKYIDFTYDELLMMPEIAKKAVCMIMLMRAPRPISSPSLMALMT